MYICNELNIQNLANFIDGENKPKTNDCLYDTGTTNTHNARKSFEFALHFIQSVVCVLPLFLQILCFSCLSPLILFDLCLSHFIEKERERKKRHKWEVHWYRRKWAKRKSIFTNTFKLFSDNNFLSNLLFFYDIYLAHRYMMIFLFRWYFKILE